MEVFTLHASNIKGYAFEFACASCRASCVKEALGSCFWGSEIAVETKPSVWKFHLHCMGSPAPKCNLQNSSFREEPPLSARRLFHKPEKISLERNLNSKHAQTWTLNAKSEQLMKIPSALEGLHTESFFLLRGCRKSPLNNRIPWRVSSRAPLTGSTLKTQVSAYKPWKPPSICSTNS